MKTHYHTLAALAFASLATPLSHAQTYTDTTDPLSIKVGEVISESYVNRTTDDEQERISSVSVGGSYYGHNINITHNSSDRTDSPTNAAIWAFDSEGDGPIVRLTADEGTWNTITTNGSQARGFAIQSNSANTNIYLSRLQININGESSEGLFLNTIARYVQNPIIYSLDDVEIVLKGKDSTGIVLKASAIATNQGMGDVRITSSDPSVNATAIELRMGGGGRGKVNGRVRLSGATIDIAKGTIFKTGDGRGYHVASDDFYAEVKKTASLVSNSTIKSGDHNALISGRCVHITFDHVDLSQAKNQRIELTTSSVIWFTNGTAFDGYTTMADGKDLVIFIDNASWHVRRDSSLGSGTLSLANRAALCFSADGTPGDFTNINAAAVMLGQGTLLQLDADSGLFSKGDVITLFTGLAQDGYTNDGALLVTADGMVLAYDDLGDGSYRYTGQMYHLIPEPATASLGLLGLAALACRRRR